MASSFRLLLAEDDPVSRMFLSEALATAGHAVSVVANGRDALALAREQRFDLLLLDLNLPLLRGDQILEELRSDTHAGSHRTTALALTAETGPDIHRALLLGGFADVLCKPIGINPLLCAVDQHVGATVKASASAHQSTVNDDAAAAHLSTPVDPASPPNHGQTFMASALADAQVWDDGIALAAANGSPEIVAALRPLLLQELPRQRANTLNALDQGDLERARGELHRLRAACGFCGARQLALAVDALAADLAGGMASNATRVAFEHASARLLVTPAPKPLPTHA